MADDTSRRENAVKALARHLYDTSAPKAAPEFDRAPFMVQHSFMEGALPLTKIVLEAAEQGEPDLEVLKMRVRLLADEVGVARTVKGAEVKEHLLDLLVDL